MARATAIETTAPLTKMSETDRQAVIKRLVDTFKGQLHFEGYQPALTDVCDPTLVFRYGVVQEFQIHLFDDTPDEAELARLLKAAVKICRQIGASGVMFFHSFETVVSLAEAA